MLTSQLSRFSDTGAVGSNFKVNSLGSKHRHYLLWSKTQDEAVLNMQGVIAEAYIPPITNTNMWELSCFHYCQHWSPPENWFLKHISRSRSCQPQMTFNSQTLYTPSVDSRIFMVCHYSPMEGNGITAMVGDIPAIRVENRLLVPRNSCQDGAMEPTQDVDPEGLLRATIRQGAHMYMENNMIIFREWTQDAKGKLWALTTSNTYLTEPNTRLSKATHPGTLKAGDVVNLGLSFCILHFSGKGHFQIWLDSIAILDRRGSDVHKIKPVWLHHSFQHRPWTNPSWVGWKQPQETDVLQRSIRYPLVQPITRNRYSYFNHTCSCKIRVW